jgi:hypothetical protein
VRLTVHRASLVLPARDPRAEDENLRPFEPPEGAPKLAVEELAEEPTRRAVKRDVGTGETVLDYSYGSGRRHPDGLELVERTHQTFRIVEGDPLSASVRVWELVSIGRGGWKTRAETESEMTCDADAFHVVNTVTAYEGDEVVFEKKRRFSAPRDLV